MDQKLPRSTNNQKLGNCEQSIVHRYVADEGGHLLTNVTLKAETVNRSIEVHIE